MDNNIQITNNDVLFGKGSHIDTHPGNIYFRRVADSYKAQYVASPKLQKKDLARLVVKRIEELDPPGRFIQQDKETGSLNVVPPNKAIEKAMQRIRQGTSSSTPPHSPLLIASQAIEATSTERDLQQAIILPSSSGSSSLRSSPPTTSTSQSVYETSNDSASTACLPMNICRHSFPALPTISYEANMDDGQFDDAEEHESSIYPDT